MSRRASHPEDRRSAESRRSHVRVPTPESSRPEKVTVRFGRRSSTLLIGRWIRRFLAVVRLAIVGEFLGEGNHFLLCEPSVHSHEGRWNNGDDNAVVGVDHWNDKVVALLKAPIKGRVRVGFDRLDAPSHL